MLLVINIKQFVRNINKTCLEKIFNCKKTNERMVSLVKLLLFCFSYVLIEGNFTKVSRKNVLLSRRKRYLQFPMGSNFVISMSYVKAIQQVQPTGWNVLGECDVPFPLPSDNIFFKKGRRRHYLERREIYSQFETTMDQNGLNGKACVKRMICEAERYALLKGKSLVKDLLYAVFTSPEAGLDIEYEDVCDNSNFLECSISILDYIVNMSHVKE